jgi:hypothetical protein
MKRLFPFLFGLFISLNTVAQKSDPFHLTISKKEKVGEFSIYEVSVRNYSDSIVCVIHSIFVNLNASEPQGITLFTSDKDNEMYNLKRSFEDTSYNSWGIPQKGAFVLPYQSLKFKIKLLGLNDKWKELMVNYIYFVNLCYKEIITEMKEEPGRWYNKFNQKSKSVKL